MTSPGGVAGTGLTLLAVPLALAISMAAGDAELLLHFLLGAGFVLTSLALFDFGVTRWGDWVGAGGIGGLGAIFILQGVSDLLGGDALRQFAYEVLGQRLERVLPDLFLCWCAVMLVQRSRDRTRLFGLVVVGLVIGLEVIDYASRWSGRGLPGISKLAYLLPFAWLLTESAKGALLDRVESR